MASIFDSRDAATLRTEGMDEIARTDGTWHDQMKATGEAKTQAFAQRAANAGYHGLLVQSFAPGATQDDLNLVLWDWSRAVTLIDDESLWQTRRGSFVPSWLSHEPLLEIPDIAEEDWHKDEAEGC